MNSLVALPIVAAVPTTAPSLPSEVDPIFAAIAEYNNVDAALTVAFAREPLDESELDKLYDRLYAADDAVIRTRPSTPAGLAALTTWARERMDWLRTNGSTLDGNRLFAISAAIDDATRGMAGLQPWSPPPVSTDFSPDGALSTLADQYAIAYKKWSDLNRNFDKKYGSGGDDPPPGEYRAAERNVGQAETAYRCIEEQLSEMPALTMAGMRAKVRAAQAYMEGHNFDFIDGSCPEAMARSIFADIMRLA